MIRTLICLGMLIAAALSFGACNDDDGGGDGGDSGNGGGDSLSLDSYFGEVKRLNDEAESRFDEIQPDLGAEGSVEEGKQAFIEFFDEIRAVFKDFLDELEQLNPPDDAEELHNNSVEAGNDALAALEQAIEEVKELDSIDDIAGIDAPDFDAATERFDQACKDLQALADENNIEVALDCE